MSMVDTVYVMSGGEFFQAAFNGVATLIGTSTWDSLFHIVGFFSAMALFFVYIRGHDPKEVLKFIAVFILITSVLVIPKRTVHIIDMTNPTLVLRVDNVPTGLSVPFRFITSIGGSLTKIYDSVFHTPDSVAYSKTGMLFGATLMANTTDVVAQNGDLAMLLSEYVQQCVIGDIMLTHKYSMAELMQSSDPYEIIFRKPSPLRGVIVPRGNSLAQAGFQTCEALANNVLKRELKVDTTKGGKTWDYYVNRFIGPRASADTLFGLMMADSYGFYYQGGRDASEILRQNVVMNAIKQGITTHTAASGNVASLVNMADQSSNSKMRLSWAASGGLAATFVPVMHTVLMAMLVGMFPIIILLATIHGLTLPVLKGYVFSLVYLQSWPPLYAILNYAMAFYLKGETKGMNFSLSNLNTIQQTHSDIGLMAAWLSNSIPFIAAGLVFGLWRVVSQAGNYLGSSINSTASSAASQAADGTWAFNNMQMENVSGFKWDTNQSVRDGQMLTQHASGATTTKTAGGGILHDGKSAVSSLATDIQFGRMLSSSYQAQQREAESQVQSLSNSISRGSQLVGSQLTQWAQQRGNSDTVVSGADSSRATTLTQAINKLNSVADALAKRNGISTSEAVKEVLNKSQSGDFSAGVSLSVGKDELFGFLSAKANTDFSYKGSDQSSHGINSDISSKTDRDHSLTAQETKDVRDAMDVINNHRTTDNSSHTDNASSSLSDQLASNLSDLQSQIKQYNDALNRSHEYAQMASYAENNSASINSNYSQEFVNYVHQSAPGRATTVLTDAGSPSLRVEREQLAQAFVDEKLKPQLEQEFRENRLRASEGMGSVGPAAGMQSDLKKEHAESVAGMEQRASGAAVKTSEQIQNQVRDARQTVESQVLKNEQEVASSKKALGTERDALSEQYKDSEKAFDEALVQERQKQKPLPLSPSDAWNSDKNEENMRRLRNVAKWKDK
ncbi:conjugal transfer protein TraG [Salmonella enterica subsp. enterica serovar Bareilly str. CFSAN000220]|uniref:Conjugal transfer protein TraG n=1 Tax=Salmonella enterica subsp. enterica serovar Bareilly TaxID=58096 RepID=A0A5U9SVM9_SALET|nr:conjugal transfer mating-pair stabilization protein TraG [Salmonella enterica]EBS4098046.1 conjugal transfer protein TraG [Salmonella enterica subsp. enterica serovar Bareilly]EDE7122287.1 conjugal transfer mating pair stabilization protein TraG [Salmonella enterica subsp. enterica serovar Hvittingfoss]EAM8390329.1 conjugal transfer protein TraG [Salmonella enterica]EAU2345945.1 conjugal transfer protein TraG [Salmonella enterica]EAX1391496.1 conjugal transfer protein TraG [Salmonella enter